MSWKFWNPVTFQCSCLLFLRKVVEKTCSSLGGVQQRIPTRQEIFWNGRIGRFLLKLQGINVWSSCKGLQKHPYSKSRKLSHAMPSAWTFGIKTCTVFWGGGKHSDAMFVGAKRQVVMTGFSADSQQKSILTDKSTGLRSQNLSFERHSTFKIAIKTTLNVESKKNLRIPFHKTHAILVEQCHAGIPSM